MNHVEEWFSSRKLGLFLHFGLYSIEGWHEQDQMRRRIPRSEYGKLISKFNPISFNPDAIIDLAESLGMEYLCITTKHHDGFCLWDTQHTDFNVMHSPYGKDLLGELAQACHRRNFPLGLYYSIADWHHPNYPNQGRHHELEGPEAGDNPNWNLYVEYLKDQVRELCTKYGEVRHFFWDINVPEHVDPSINVMIRELQPKIVINNRGFDEGDFGTPEREYQDDETSRQHFFSRPTEACNSIGTQSWGFRKNESYYASNFLIHSIDSMMAKGANYLLNVGPDEKGAIPEIGKKILTDIGQWYSKVRESFSDTIPCSELTRSDEVFLTRRENTLYVHLPFPARSDTVLLPPISSLPQKATLLNTGTELKCSNDVLPMFWRKKPRFLQVHGIPQHALGGKETLVIKLEFDQEISGTLEQIEVFRG